MSDRREWAQLADYASGFEADIVRAQLESAEIPVIAKGPEIGIFGPGFSGPTARGVRLFVPQERLEEARGLLEEV